MIRAQLMRREAFPTVTSGKESTCNAGNTADTCLILGSGRRPGPSSILAVKIPWTEKPGGLQFMGSCP